MFTVSHEFTTQLNVHAWDCEQRGLWWVANSLRECARILRQESELARRHEIIATATVAVTCGRSLPKHCADALPGSVVDTYEDVRHAWRHGLRSLVPGHEDEGPMGLCHVRLVIEDPECLGAANLQIVAIDGREQMHTITYGGPKL